MRKWKRLLLAIAIGGGIALGGCATTATYESPFDLKGLFEALDKNQDGKISLEEYRAIWRNPADAEKEFRQMDQNQDGFLMLQEFRNPGITIFRW